jgi:hypothetical protein
VTPRVRAAAGAGLIVLAYLGGAYVSGRLSPASRRPLLDGLAPSAPYRWVKPPPGVAGNKPPTPATFTIEILANGVPGGAFTTPDAQVTAIVPSKAIPPSPGQRSVRVSLTPVDPAGLAPPPPGRILLGNAVRIAATYEPGGDPVTTLDRGIEVVLVYPFVLNDGGDHVLLVSDDGGVWRKIRTTDHVAPSQAIGTIPSFGYVVVSGRRGQVSTSPAGESGGGEGVPIAIVAAAVVLVGLLLLILFGGRRGSGGRQDRRRPGP